MELNRWIINPPWMRKAMYSLPWKSNNQKKLKRELDSNEGFPPSNAINAIKHSPTLGQALGGHKRCHWKGPAKATPSHEVALPGEASQNTSNSESSGEANQAGEASACSLSFDLNIPYIMGGWRIDFFFFS
ncbi:hypothetical protein OIU78_019208 [Salix suchowensis]|nr:hypothetical protein OIU78_019208 [Salix suchowensis]